MAFVATFDFNSVTVSVAGQPITGFADADDAIIAARRNSSVDLIPGADEDSVFVKKGDKSALITLKLLPSSASNTWLSELNLAAEQFRPIPFIVDITDGENGTTHVNSVAGLIEKVPDLTRGKNLTSNDWVILCADCDMKIDGMNR